MITCLAVPFVVKSLLYELAGMPQWVVACIGTSLAIGTMCKMGTVHPRKFHETICIHYI